MFFEEWLDILFYKKKPEQIVAEKPELGQALTSYVIALAIVLVIGAIQTLVVPSPAGAFMAVSVLIGGLITGIIGVLIGAIVLHLFAMVVGGKGDFNTTIASIIKLDAAYTGTIGVLSALVSLIVALAPALSMIALAWSGLVFIAGLYLLVLLVLLIKAAHNLSTGRAVVAVVVIPAAIVLLLALLLGVAFSTLLTEAASNLPTVNAGLFSLLG